VQNHAIKIKAVLDQTSLNPVEQTADLELKGHLDDKGKDVLEGKAVVIIDPLTGRALGASDFFQMTTFAHQADVALSQANPVSTTIYTVLPTTTNARLIGIAIQVTWATTQPTPLEVLINVDGQTVGCFVNNPVTATWYYCVINPNDPAQVMLTTNPSETRAFLLEGRSVSVTCRVTWAVTQPTPMVCRVKWARKS